MKDVDKLVAIEKRPCDFHRCEARDRGLVTIAGAVERLICQSYPDRMDSMQVGSWCCIVSLTHTALKDSSSSGADNATPTPFLQQAIRSIDNSSESATSGSRGGEQARHAGSC